MADRHEHATHIKFSGRRVNRAVQADSGNLVAVPDDFIAAAIPDRFAVRVFARPLRHERGGRFLRRGCAID